MEILVTGASGLLGRSVLTQLGNNPRFSVTGAAFSRAGENLLKLDLTDSAAVEETLRQVQPKVVIHCAAERWPDRCAENPEAAWQLNVQSTEKLAQLCREAGAQLVYISTDYVFDGAAPPYSENDTPNPINFYGRSKLAGEKAVLDNGSHWVLRVPMLFGPVTYLTECGITALLDSVRNPEPQTLDHWATRYPTSSEDIALVLEQCMEKIAGGRGFSGIYQWSGDVACTRFELAQMVARASGFSAEHLSGDPEPQFAEPRPQNCQLDKSRLAELGISVPAPQEPPSLKQQLARYLEPYL